MVEKHEVGGLGPHWTIFRWASSSRNRLCKKNNNKIRKKFQIAINLLSLATTSTLILEIVRDTPK